MWYAGIEGRTLSAIGDGSNRWAMVHVDDLSDGYLRVGESGLAGEAFNFTDRSRWSVRDLVGAVAHAAGYTGEIQFIPLTEAAKNMGPFAQCLALNQHVDSRKAVRLLGWHPRHGGFVDEVHIFYASWKAVQQA
jgi:nucleoside-diphosphate-sugar epimerase